MSGIRHIVFDIGNVLLRYDPFTYMLQHYEHAERLYELIAPSVEWQKLDHGDLTTTEAIEAFTKKDPDLKDEIEDYMHHWTNMLEPIPEHVFCKNILSEDYSIYLLSNFHHDAFKEMEIKHPFLKNVNGKIISADVHQMKPQPEIYQLLLSTYHLSASECLFIDDTIANLNTAQLLGFQTMQLTPNERMFGKLKEFVDI